MIIIYHKDESPQAKNIPLKDLKEFWPPYSEKHIQDADKVFVLDGEHFRIFKNRDVSLNPDDVFSLSSIHLFLKELERPIMKG